MRGGARAWLGPIMMAAILGGKATEASALDVEPKLLSDSSISFLEKPDENAEPSVVEGLTKYQLDTLRRAANGDGVKEGEVKERAFLCVKDPRDTFCTIQEYGSHYATLAPIPMNMAVGLSREGKQVIAGHTHPPDNEFSPMNVPSPADISLAIRFMDTGVSADGKNLRNIAVTGSGVWEYGAQKGDRRIGMFIEESKRLRMMQKAAILDLINAIPDDELDRVEALLQDVPAENMDEKDRIINQELGPMIYPKLEEASFKLYIDRYGKTEEGGKYLTFWNTYLALAKHEDTEKFTRFASENGINITYTPIP